MTRKTDSLIHLARAYLSKYDPYFFNRLYQYIWYRALDESDAYGMAAVSTLPATPPNTFSLKRR